MPHLTLQQIEAMDFPVHEVKLPKCKVCEHRSCCKNYNIDLTPLEGDNPLFRNKITPEFLKKGIFQIQKPCPFLTDDGCSIYDRRPKVCREYDCKNDERIKM